ncbi:hypothetical protein FA893_10720 [Photobacterium damselae subsp. piscicida]|uniref:gamma-mobile-trio protein GmtX n=1 Tax=Photobacterium damselae TaxID=38293 RepID=UPI0003082A3B|nr:gamma-mobile-trio protein GmtX [Photobacterium damselae]OLQ83459.1 hypothetical protein BEI67_10360 [Photobacterium damselae subsp. piscicida]TFZ54319.1 hypothetical protein E4T25_14830 [Photobacterium damselae subsp. piscicida]TJZ90689.1 hypothetical protein FA893_10720 [Photobacterium damselae subsp. piscicida]BBC41320.1 hypothetical protein PDPE_1-02161 [Photobacterium damselae subsp. piscicida]
MNKKTYTTELEIQSLYDLLAEQVTKSDTKKTVKAIHEICKKLVGNNSTPTVATIVKLLGNQGIMVSSRTIYNRRSGKNPYPVLIDAWASFSAQKSAKVTASIESGDQLITDNDLMKITDSVLRHKVMIMFGQHKSLMKENSGLREIRNLPLVSPDSTSGGYIQQLAFSQSKLDSYDLEVLKKFLVGNELKGLVFDEYGALKSTKLIKRDEVLSELGLKEAIEKLIPRDLMLAE